MPDLVWSAPTANILSTLLTSLLLMRSSWSFTLKLQTNPFINFFYYSTDTYMYITIRRWIPIILYPIKMYRLYRKKNTINGYFLHNYTFWLGTSFFFLNTDFALDLRNSGRYCGLCTIKILVNRCSYTLSDAYQIYETSLEFSEKCLFVCLC